MVELTHASFFSGVGGLDLGLERAGWRTVSFSEIDPYACAVLSERWPGVPNLGCIQTLAGYYVPHDHITGPRGLVCVPLGSRDRHARPERSESDPDAGPDAAGASLWTGGFPCQDLSVAGNRRGMGAGTRSGLAFAFLDLAAVYRPRFVLLENVPGLLSSHGGRDMAALLGALVELGYGVGYRVLDARHFGVPQRRRRVFILGDSTGGRAGAERAAEVLSVGSRCHRHPPAGIQAGEGTADGARPGVDIARTVVGTAGKRHGASPDPDRMRAPDGLAGRAHDRDVAATLNSGGNDGGFRTEPGEHLVTAFVKHRRAGEDDPSPESWGPGELSGTVDSIGHGPRTATAIVGPGGMTDDPMLPLGLDSHRYRCCGNGVVADVAEWIGLRLAAIT